MPRIAMIVFLGVATLLGNRAQAEVFRSAPLPGGKFSLGMEPEITFNGDTDATFYMHGGFGLGSGYGLHGRIGFGQSPFNDDDVALRGMFDMTLLKDGRGYPGLFLALGVSSLGKVAISNHLILHNDFGVVTIYGGMDDNLTFVDDSSGDDVKFPVELVFGGEFEVNRHFKFLFEGGIDLNDSASYISGGLKFYL